jgi:predicted amidohydrolase
VPLPNPLRVSLLHLAPVLGDVDSNRAILESATRLSAELGADWVVSGELVVPGYTFESEIGTDWIRPQPDRWLHAFALLTADAGVVSFVSHPERDERTGALYNSLFVIGRDGRMLGRHRKLRPTPGSEDWSSSGEQPDPVDLDGTKVGLLICADAYPSAPAGRLRAQGAEIFLSAAAWWPGEWGPNGEWERCTRDNDVPMIVCNRTGLDGSFDLRHAESVVVDRGRRLATLTADESTLFLLECAVNDGHITRCDVTPVRLAPMLIDPGRWLAPANARCRAAGKA